MSAPVKPNISNDPLVLLFQSIGVSQAKAYEVLKSPKNAAALKDIIEKHPVVSKGGLDEKQVTLIVALAGALVKSNGVGQGEREYLVNKIVEGKLKSVDQVGGTYFECVYTTLSSIQTLIYSRREIHGNPPSAH